MLLSVSPTVGRYFKIKCEPAVLSRFNELQSGVGWTQEGTTTNPARLSPDELFTRGAKVPYELFLAGKTNGAFSDDNTQVHGYVRNRCSQTSPRRRLMASVDGRNDKW